jgi:hypothetical protein
MPTRQPPQFCNKQGLVKNEKIIKIPSLMTFKTSSVLNVIRLRILIFLVFDRALFVTKYLLCFLACHFGMSVRPNQRNTSGFLVPSHSNIIATDLESHFTLLYPQLGFNYNTQRWIVLKELSNNVRKVKISTNYRTQALFGRHTYGTFNMLQCHTILLAQN